MNSWWDDFDVKTHDIRDGDVTTRREIETEHILFFRISGYKRWNDIIEGDATEVRV